MAKAKKTAPTPAAGEAPVTPPAATGKKKPTAKAKAPAPIAGGAPMIDTTLAAESAAKRLVAGLNPTAANTPSNHESAAFRQMKEGLTNHAPASLNSLLNSTAGPGQKKPNAPFFGGKQTGRNQTFGADVSRASVPRRTGGG